MPYAAFSAFIIQNVRRVTLLYCGVQVNSRVASILQEGGYAKAVVGSTLPSGCSWASGHLASCITLDPVDRRRHWKSLTSQDLLYHCSA